MDGLGETIKQLRKDNHMTQVQLAEKLNVSKGLISMWENNVNEQKASFIRKLAIVFNVSSDYILGLE